VATYRAENKYGGQTATAAMASNVFDEFDDADLFDTPSVRQLWAHDPGAKARAARKHEAKKATFHAEVSRPEREATVRWKNRPPLVYQGVKWTVVEKDLWEPAFDEQSLILVKGIWTKKGKPTRSIWYPSVVVPRNAWTTKGFDLGRAFNSADTPVWELGVRLSSRGVFWTRLDDCRPFWPSDEIQNQCKGWPKKFRKEFDKAYADAVRLMDVVKANKVRRDAGWAKQREDEDAEEAAEEAYRAQCANAVTVAACKKWRPRL